MPMTARPSLNVSTALPESSITAAMPRRPWRRTSRHLPFDNSLSTTTPGATQLQSDLALSYHDIGAIHRAGGRAAEALAAYERRVRSGRSSPRPIRPPRNSRGTWPRATSTSATCIKRRNDSPRHSQSFEQARAILQKLADTYPAVSRFEGDLAQSDQGIGSIQNLTGHPPWHVASFERARDDLSKNWPTPTRRSRSFRPGSP